MVDVNKPVTNPDFIQAIQNMKEMRNQESKANFFEEFAKAHFLAPATIDPPPAKGETGEDVVLKKGTKINYAVINNEKDELYFPAFTDWENLYKWDPTKEQQTMITRMEDYAAMVLQEGSQIQGIVINPFGDNVLIPRELLAHLTGTAMPVKVEENTEVLLGEPAKYPFAMIEAVTTYADEQKDIKKLFLKLMVKDGQQSYLIVVDFEEDRKDIFNGIAQVAIPHLGDMFLDLVPYHTDLGKQAADGAKPFFHRS